MTTLTARQVVKLASDKYHEEGRLEIDPPATDLQAKTAQSELKERAQTQREQIKTDRELTLAQVEGETRRAAELADIVAAQT